MSIFTRLGAPGRNSEAEDVEKFFDHLDDEVKMNSPGREGRSLKFVPDHLLSHFSSRKRCRFVYLNWFLLESCDKMHTEIYVSFCSMRVN
jgi:hypothetical protein